MGKTAVIGAGPAGMTAALFAARAGQEVWLYEKNEKIGKKLFITGKGRCNLTNRCDRETFFAHIVTNKKFLMSAFSRFGNEDVIALVESLGVRTKVERGGRVFPASDHSSDVIRALGRGLEQAGVHVCLGARVEELWMENGILQGICLAGAGRQKADSVIVATGGLSYQSTGSTGDGYRFARQAGHHVTALGPSLAPMNAGEDWVRELQGLSLKNVSIAIRDGSSGKRLYEGFGEMLFTHFGVSGPLILSASSFVGSALERHPARLSLDLKPALSEEQLDKRILRDFGEAPNRQFKNALSRLLPTKLIPVVVRLSGIGPEKAIHDITKQERQGLVGLLKALPITLTGLRDINEAIVTRGGVDVKEINPRTLESKLVDNLYFVGEVLDVDGLTGGFNLQIAFSTGHAAAMGVS